MSFSILGKCKELEEERPEFYEDLNLIPLIKEMQELAGEEDLSEFFYRMPDGIEQIRYRQEILQEMDEEMEQKLTDFVNRIRQAKKEEEYISSETGEQITDAASKAHWQLEIAYTYFKAVDELMQFLENRNLKARGWQEFQEMCKREIGEERVQTYHDAVMELHDKFSKLRYSLRVEGDHAVSYTHLTLPTILRV